MNDKNINGNVTIAQNQDNNLILDTVVEREIPKKKVKKKRYKYIRTTLRHELSKMIIREIISQDDLD